MSRILWFLLLPTVLFHHVMHWPLRVFNQGLPCHMLLDLSCCQKSWNKILWPLYSWVLYASKASIMWTALPSSAASSGWTLPPRTALAAVLLFSCFLGADNAFSLLLSQIGSLYRWTLALRATSCWRPLLMSLSLHLSAQSAALSSGCCSSFP